MQIVIPGGFPPPPYAAELARHLPEYAPSLVDLLGRARARVEPFDPATAGCTPFEAWQLEQAGYVVQPDLPLGAGLGPLLAGATATATAPVWLADFVHLALGTDHASLVTADVLAPSRQEAQTLLDAVTPALAEHGFSARLLDAHRILLTLPPGLAPRTASPAAVAGQHLQTWWATDPDSRPWRRALNDIQMIWHAHPVNAAREGYGQLPVNALWLYGGALPWARPAPRDDEAPTVLTSLAAAARAGDWASWLDALAGLEASTFKPLLHSRSGRPAALSLILMGERRIAHVTLAPPPAWLRWLPRQTTNWKHWWSLPA